MSKHILICDDDEGILDVAKIVLHDKGYRVTALRSCSDIEKIIVKEKPDVILLDLWMPGMGGEELAKKLKADKKYKQIPIIVVSARRDTEEAAKNSRADDFLLKPFDIEQLEQIVEKHLQ